MSSIAVIRPQVGMMLSIGLPPNSEGNPGNHPKKLGYFRAKPGAQLQYLSAAERFADAYGPEPTQVEVLFVSDDVGLNLDIRPKVFRQSGLKALGTRNLATLPPDEFAEALYSYTETLDVYPDDDSPMIQYELQGPTDKLVRREVPGRNGGRSKIVQDCKVYGVLRFSIPEVTGLMTLVEISTTSRRSMKNLYAGIHMARQITQGTLTGIPLVLSVRPATGRYFDAEAGKKKSTTYYELALDTRDTYREVWELAVERRALAPADVPALPPAPIDHADLDRDAELIPEHRALAAPPAVDIETFTEELADGPAEVTPPERGSIRDDGSEAPPRANRGSGEAEPAEHGAERPGGDATAPKPGPHAAEPDTLDPEQAGKVTFPDDLPETAWAGAPIYMVAKSAKGQAYLLRCLQMLDVDNPHRVAIACYVAAVLPELWERFCAEAAA